MSWPTLFEPVIGSDGCGVGSSGLAFSAFFSAFAWTTALSISSAVISEKKLTLFSTNLFINASAKIKDPIAFAYVFSEVNVIAVVVDGLVAVSMACDVAPVKRPVANLNLCTFAW